MINILGRFLDNAQQTNQVTKGDQSPLINQHPIGR